MKTSSLRAKKRSNIWLPPGCHSLGELLFHRKAFAKISTACIFVVRLVLLWKLTASSSFQNEPALSIEAGGVAIDPSPIIHTPQQTATTNNNSTVPPITDESLFVGRTKIVAFCNYNYRSVAKVWHSRMVHLGYDPRDLVIVAVDEKMADFLSRQQEQPVIQYQVMLLEKMPPSVAALPKKKRSRADLDLLFAVRWKFLVQQLEQGVHILLTDVDNIFSRYIPFNDHDDPNADADPFFRIEGAATVASKNPTKPVDVWHAYATKYPQNVYKKLGFTVCGGMSWWRASPPALRFAKMVHEECGVLCDDQKVLNQLLADESKVKMTWHYSLEMLKSRTSKIKKDRFTALPTVGISGVSSVTGHHTRIWNRDFAFRGAMEPEVCPAGNWVSMPIVKVESRKRAWEGKIASFEKWDSHCGTSSKQ